MSKNQQKFKEALEAKGYVYKDSEYLPIAPGGCGGAEGGWYVDYAEPPSEFGGTINEYNSADVLQAIEVLPLLASAQT